MKVSYYPGCSLEETAAAYDMSARQVCRHLDISLEEIPDWACCGSSPALKMDHLLSTALGAHNLAQARQQQLEQVVIPCPFCFRRLLSAQQETQADPDTRQAVEAAIRAELNGDLSIHSLLGFLRHTVGLETIAKQVKKPLKGLRVLPYYGCYLVKPATVTQYDDPENPVSMDALLEALAPRYWTGISRPNAAAPAWRSVKPTRSWAFPGASSARRPTKKPMPWWWPASSARPTWTCDRIRSAGGTAPGTIYRWSTLPSSWAWPLDWPTRIWD